MAGRIRYDPAVTASQLAGRTVVEHRQQGWAEDIRMRWEQIRSW